MKTDSGSVTVEMVLLAPVLMALLLFGVYSGRASESLT
ncbi:MAG: TadE/TadG family type IV pilus assembly protein, partial [Ilumatobacteraceae bacterium]